MHDPLGSQFQITNQYNQYKLILSREKTETVAIWPVTGQGFQNTKWPVVLYIFSVNFTKLKDSI